MASKPAHARDDALDTFDLEPDGNEEITSDVLVDEDPTQAVPPPPPLQKLTSFPSSPSDSSLGSSDSIAEALEAAPGDEAGESITAGQRVGGYRIERKIGSGGMGRVYAATHLKLGRKVAIKVLRSRYVFNAEALRRFFSEARVASQIIHPNIVAITDFIEGDGGPASYVMEYLEGKTLHGRLKEKEPIPLAELVEIAEQVARGLKALHDAGVVHRDVKPSNTFLLWDDEQLTVKLLDFGLVKQEVRRRRTSGELTTTKDRAVLGTPAYMPPEQMGDASNVDRRADIYAFGTVLYEMLCGYRPYKAKDETELQKKRLTEAPTPMKREGGVPAELEKLARQCLHAEPEERPQSMEEILALLQSFRDKHLAPKARQPVRILFLLLLLVALGIGTVGSWLAPGPPQEVITKPPEKAIAELKAFKKSVERRRREGRSWESAKTKMALFHLDSVRTGSRSRATVGFSAGARLKIDEDSEVLIEEPRKEKGAKKPLQVLRLRKGKMRLHVPDKASLLLIDSRGRVARVHSAGKAELRIESGPKGKTSLAVVKGDIRYSAGGASQQVKEGQIIEADGKRVSAPVALPPFPQLLSPAIDQQLQGEELAFSWKSVGEGYRYRLQISAGITFDKVIADRLLTQTSIVVDKLPLGAFAWRVSSIDPEGRVGEFGYARRFHLVAPKAVVVEGELISPRPRAVIVLGTKPRSIRFRWKSPAQKTTFVLSRQPDLQASRVLRRELKRRQTISLSSARMPPGTYYWGVFVRVGEEAKPLQPAGRRLTIGKHKAPEINVKIGGWK